MSKKDASTSELRNCSPAVGFLQGKSESPGISVGPSPNTGIVYYRGCIQVANVPLLAAEVCVPMSTP